MMRYPITTDSESHRPQPDLKGQGLPMNVSYQHANPYASNESFLLRFDHEDEQDQTACVFVDAS